MLDDDNELTDEILEFDVKTGEKQFFWKDVTPFIKMIKDDNNFEDNAGLSRPANSLFWLICGKIKPNTDIVKLTNPEYMEFSKAASRTQFYQAVVELVEKDFIAKFNSGGYFINPLRFFNGLRENLINTPPKPVWLARRGK